MSVNSYIGFRTAGATSHPRCSTRRYVAAAAVAAAVVSLPACANSSGSQQLQSGENRAPAATSTATNTDAAATAGPALTPTQASSAAQTARRTTSTVATAPWVDALREAPATRQQALAKAPANKPVRLVTVRHRNGQPVIETQVVKNRAAAMQFADEQLSDPGVLDVRPQIRVQLVATDAQPAGAATVSVKTTPSTTGDSSTSPSPSSAATTAAAAITATSPPADNNSSAAPATNSPRPSAATAATTNTPPAASRTVMSNDPDSGSQWGLSLLGAQRLWSAGRNASGIVVAVVDTGVQGNHPDLAPAVLNGIDYIRSAYRGRVDQHGHGTHIAGIIAATANNYLGGAGLAQGAKILPVRVLDATGAGTDTNVAKGVIWAANNGAKIVNLSLGSPEYSAAEQAAVAYATSRGVLVIAAAGNLRAQGNPRVYPAGYPNVLGVAAIDQRRLATSFSSTGAQVDVAAPGMSILSTVPDGYEFQSGTSMAAAFASATAAIVRKAAPRLSPGQVATALQSSAADLSPRGRDNTTGYGLIQPWNAVARAKAMPAVDTSAATTLRLISRLSSRVGYRTDATLSYQLLRGGYAFADAGVSICTTIAPDKSATCTTHRTDSQGRVWKTVTATGHISVFARHVATRSTQAATSATTRIWVLPQVLVWYGNRVLTAAIHPVGGQVALQRYSTKTKRWSTISSLFVPSNGQVRTGTMLPGTYRFAVPASSLTIPAVSSQARLR